MRGSQWIESFVESLKDNEGESFVKSGSKWTRFMRIVLECVGRKTNCYVAMRRDAPDGDEHSGEYLTLDAIFFDNDAYDRWKHDNWDPPVLPTAIVEHENEYTLEKITFCLWKILLVRSPVRVLICYQDSQENVSRMIGFLEKTILRENLMHGIVDDLIVVIGDESKPDRCAWGDYYTFYEWRNGTFSKIAAPSDDDMGSGPAF